MVQQNAKRAAQLPRRPKRAPPRLEHSGRSSDSSPVDHIVVQPRSGSDSFPEVRTGFTFEPWTSFSNECHNSEGTSPRFALTEDANSVALSVFFSRYCCQHRDPDGEPGLNNNLPRLYTESQTSSALTNAITAFALGIAGRWPERLDWKRLSVNYYGRAVASLNVALTGPQQLRNDELLATVMQLIAYEKLNLPHIPGSAFSHVNGLMTILKLRGVQTCDTEVSKQLLLLARTHALTIYCSPMQNLSDDEHLWEDAPVDRPGNLGTSLVKIASQIRVLRRIANATSSSDNSDQEQVLETVGQMISIAMKIDSELLEWAASTPIRWEPVAADVVPLSVQAAGVWKNTCTIDHNIWSSISWNKYRLARIALPSILLHQAQRVAESEAKWQLIIESQKVLRSEVDGICATVPFHLGSRDTSKTTDQPLIEFPSSNRVQLTEETREHLVTLGEWFLFWPFSRVLHNLEWVSAVYPTCVDEEQLHWMREQVARNGRRATTRSSLTPHI